MAIMNDIDEIRRSNIKILEKEAGSPSAIAKFVGMSDSQYANLRDGAKDSKTGKPRGMRKETARKFEIAMNKPIGWLDQNHNAHLESLIILRKEYIALRSELMQEMGITDPLKISPDNPNADRKIQLLQKTIEDLGREIDEFDLSNESPNFGEGPDMRGKVPMISLVKAGEFSETIDILQPGDAIDWVDTTVQIRPHTFALRVEGDSMEPDFPAGTILIVEPDFEALAGDFVIAKNGAEEATFKQLVKDGGDWYLKPLNTRYPIKPLSNGHIVGVVRAAERKFR